MQSEFACGNDLTRKHIDEEDIENLIIQQIEFCNIILLNKAAEVKAEELERIRQIIRRLQPAAEIIECNYADVDLNRIISTNLFNFERVATSAGWIREIERQATEEEENEAKHPGIGTKKSIITTDTMRKKTATAITTTMRKEAKWKNTGSSLCLLPPSGIRHPQARPFHRKQMAEKCNPHERGMLFQPQPRHVVPV